MKSILSYLIYSTIIKSKINHGVVGARSAPETWEDAASSLAAAAAPLFPEEDAAAFRESLLLLSFPPDLPLIDSLLLGGVPPFTEVPLALGPGSFFAVAGLLGLTRDPNGPSWSVVSFCST